MKRSSLFFLLLFFGLARCAHAGIFATEVMYDFPGVEDGGKHEWIEAYNSGPTAIDLGAADFRLFDKSGDHLVASFEGSNTVLAAGAVAVVANNPEQFRLDNPGFSGILFDGSFSLAGTETTIGFKIKGSTTPLDSATYSSALGANDNGESLHRSGASFVAGTPTPGTFSETLPQGAQTNTNPDTTQTNTQTQTQTQTQVQTQNTGGSGSPPEITVRVSGSARATAGAGSVFEASAFGTKGDPLITGVRYMWNFGDGSTAEGRRVFHTYSYPGKYVLQVTAAYPPSVASERATIVAESAQATLLAEKDGALTIVNSSEADLDVGLWSLTDGASTFTIPQDTIVLAGEGVRFAAGVTHVVGSPGSSLLYPNGAFAASASPSTDSPLRGERVPANELDTYNAPLISIPSETPARAETEDRIAEEDQGSLSAAAAESSAAFPLWSSLAGLVALVVLGVAATWYAQRRNSILGSEETKILAEEFDIT